MTIDILPLEELINLPTRCYGMQTGVYFLWCHGAIVYIGQSSNIDRRLRAHRSSNLVFNRATYLECAHPMQIALEAFYIDEYKPFHNRAGVRAGGAVAIGAA